MEAIFIDYVFNCDLIFVDFLQLLLLGIAFAKNLLLFEIAESNYYYLILHTSFLLHIIASRPLQINDFFLGSIRLK